MKVNGLGVIDIATNVEGMSRTKKGNGCLLPRCKKGNLFVEIKTIQATAQRRQTLLFLYLAESLAG
jgi:hypothetical protein